MQHEVGFWEGFKDPRPGSTELIRQVYADLPFFDVSYSWYPLVPSLASKRQMFMLTVGPWSEKQ